LLMSLPCRFIYATGILHEIHVVVIAQVSIPGKNIFQSVVVEIREQGRPTPVGIRDTGKLADLAESGKAVWSEAPIELQSISHVLVVVAAVNGQGVTVKFVRTFQQFLPAVVFRKHIEDDNIL